MYVHVAHIYNLSFLYFMALISVILDIVLSQTMPVIFVGDPNQQIYGFRGAQNALENIGATHTYHLTKVCLCFPYRFCSFNKCLWLM